MRGETVRLPDATNDDAWLRQYYTRKKLEPAPSESAPALTPQPAEKYGEARHLGSGGEKDVTRVRDRDTLRDVALARPRNGCSVQSFIREARLLARLEHPHIVPVHDLGLAPDGRPYFTMKLLAGETLETVLARLRQGDAATLAAYPLPVLLDVFVRVCEAVAFAHSRGIIHRDIKPANVQIGEYGEVQLIDWGLAKSLGDLSDPADRTDPADPVDPTLTLAGMVKGTPGYMAPEQAAGKAADVRTDTYALGALLYALLTWQPPIDGKGTTELLCKTVAGEIVPPRQRAPDRILPHALEAIVGKALAKDPDERYPTVDALLADLHAFTNGYATSAEEAGPIRLLWLVVKRHRTLLLVIAASMLSLAIVGAVAVQDIRVSRDKMRTALEDLRAAQASRALLSRAAVPKLLADARTQIRTLAYDEALDTLQTVIDVDSDQADAWDLAGWIYLGQERFALAASTFGRKLQTFVDATKASKGTSATARRHRLKGGGEESGVDSGLALAEGALRLIHENQHPLAPEEFRQLVEQARNAGTRATRENIRTALGVYYSRHNPEAGTNADYRAFVQWGVHTLNEGRGELDLRPAATGLEARVTGSAANDLLPLTGLPLVLLDLHGTAVRDLQPLRGMPLQVLDISNTAVTTFDAIYGLPLREFFAEGFRKLPADLFTRCPTLESVTVSAGAELSRQNATWPAGVKVIRGR